MNVVYTKFGGFIPDGDTFLDSFYIGSVYGEQEHAPMWIDWKLMPQYKLPIQLEGCGHVHYGSYLITFGGLTTDFKDTDDIFILNFRNDEGWKKSPLQCPLKSAFTAVLDHLLVVHLFTC